MLTKTSTLFQKNISIIATCLLLLMSYVVVGQNCANAVDSAFFTKSPTHCDNNNGQIVIDSVWHGVTPVTYSLNNGAYQGSNIFPNLAQGSYTLKVKDANGCIYTYPPSILVTKVAGPTTFNSSTTSVTVCNASDGKITVNITGGTVPYTYSLNGAPFQSSNVFNGIAAGTYAVTVKDAGGCDSTTFAIVPDQNGITAGSATVTNSACSAPSGSITAISAGSTPISYQLTPPGTTQATPTFNTNIASGSYTLLMTDVSGCKYTVYNIWVGETPVQKGYQVTTKTDTCSRGKGEIKFTAQAGGPCAYSVALGSGAYQPVTCAPNFFTFSNLAANAYTFHIKDVSGCIFDTSITLPTTTKPQGTITTNPTDCNANNGSVVVTNISGGVNPYTTTIIGHATLTGLAEGSYQLVIADAAKCNDTSQVDISKKNTIIFINATATNVVCGQSFANITLAGVQGGTAPVTYTLDGIAATGNTISNVQLGAHQLHAVDSKGCDHDTIIDITQSNTFECSITAIPSSIIQGESTTLNATTVGKTNTWDKVTGLTIANSPSATVSPSVTTTFVLNSSTAEGCATTCSTKVEVIPIIIPYKIFTPNEDGKNDTWQITNIENYSDSEIHLYSRWGQRIYHKASGEAYKAWDGKSLGTYVPTGTYYYVIDLNIDSLPKDQNLYKGFVEVIR